MTFTKTNFSGYSIQIRGIGTQAISVTTDPAVAVAFNDMPFIRNHFFEQEFYDVSQVEVLRGPQGTLYGRNATAGVVNLTSAKPTDQFEGMASADIGNYKNRRFEGMINLPVVDDRLDIRLAGEWTKRDGYSFNALTNSPIDGRDLWSTRATVRFKPTEAITADFVWEHFQENDDRLRSSKQLCKRDNGRETVDGFPTGIYGVAYLSQGCLPVSLYSPEAFQAPNAFSLPYFGGLVGAGQGASFGTPINGDRDAYASTVQSTDLRVIESALNPAYRAKNNVFQLNVDYAVSPSLTFTSATGYNNDFLWSTEDYNRFATQSGIFIYDPGSSLVQADGNAVCSDGSLIANGGTCPDGGTGRPSGYFCDPQLGCSNRLVAEDLSEERSWQFNQEFRLASHMTGPLNFSVGGNFMHYETEENYMVFFNTITLYNAKFTGAYWDPNNPAASQCTPYANNLGSIKKPVDPTNPGRAGYACGWMDPNPIDNLDYQGHNYFLSENPYALNSYAGFGEVYYNIFDDLKLTGGLRWTDDQKHFVDIPSAILAEGYGYVVTNVVDQEWKEWTGRFAANWTPKLDFTDQTLVYATFGHGYKAGGANPPGALFLSYISAGDVASIVHPLTFKPEFINAYELGTKNTLLDGALTLNGNLFYYDYKGYQISEIVDRTSINLNFDATIKGAELETTWEPLPGLKFSFSGGYEQTRVADGSKAVDLMDRTAGHPGWILVKPFVTQASNCLLPAYVVDYFFDPSTSSGRPGYTNNYGILYACGIAYNSGFDPVTNRQYTANPTGLNTANDDIIPGTYGGFDPLAGTPGHPYTGQNTWKGVDYGPAPNNGAGFTKDLSGNELPNAPHFTTSFTAEYSVPVTEDWAATLHGDFYWQASSWARVINDDPYDRLRGYTNVNFALILTNQNGWQATAYVKNAFDTTAITGDFLNSDDTGLTTNVFLTDPRLFGIRVTKNW